MNTFCRKLAALAASAAVGLSMIGCAATGVAATEDQDMQPSAAASAEQTAAPDASGGQNKPSDRPQGSSSSATAELAAPDKTEFKDKDLKDTWDPNAGQIALNGSSATSDAQGVSIDGTVVTIKSAGSYVLSGTLDNGRIVVEAGEQDDVQLVLNGVQITSADGPAVEVRTADKAILTLADGTSNKAADAADYADTADTAPDAAVYSEQDLSINGSGTLTVEGNYNNGIATKDDLKIAGGNISVKAVNNALKGKDSVSILDGTFSLESGGDAIQSDKSGDETKGWVVIDGGDFTITAGNDAVQSETGMTVNGGTFNVTTNGGADNAADKTHNAFGFGERPGNVNGTTEGGQSGFFGKPGRPGSADSAENTRPKRDRRDQDAQSGAAAQDAAANVKLAASTEEVQPAEEVSPEVQGDTAANAQDAASEATQEGRRRRPESQEQKPQARPSDGTAGSEQGSADQQQKPDRPSADAGSASADGTASDSCKGLKAGGVLTVNGGTFSLNCADDAVHSDSSVNLNGGSFTISTGDDGVHAEADLRINADIKIEKSYEGLEGLRVNIESGNIDINSEDDSVNAAGGTGSRGFGQPGRQSECGIEVSGGTVRAVAGGDGFDSNGNILVSGGDITMLISSSADNCAMDAESSFIVTGGNIIYGGSGTGAGPGSGSTQSYVFARGSFSAGTEVGLRKDGKTLISFTPAIDCSSLSFSLPGIASGETYEVYSGGTLAATAEAGQGSTGMAGGMGGGRPFGNQQTEGAAQGGTRPDGQRPELPDAVSPENAPELPDGMTPGELPELPDGMTPGESPELPDGTTPVQPPSGNGSQNGRPQRPGQGTAPDGITSPTMSEGQQGADPT